MFVAVLQHTSEKTHSSGPDRVCAGPAIIAIDAVGRLSLVKGAMRGASWNAAPNAINGRSMAALTSHPRGDRRCGLSGRVAVARDHPGQRGFRSGLAAVGAFVGRDPKDLCPESAAIGEE